MSDIVGLLLEAAPVLTGAGAALFLLYRDNLALERT
jgi:hypothetical protein